MNETQDFITAAVKELHCMKVPKQKLMLLQGLKKKKRTSILRTSGVSVE